MIGLHLRFFAQHQAEKCCLIAAAGDIRQRQTVGSQGCRACQAVQMRLFGPCAGQLHRNLSRIRHKTGLNVTGAKCRAVLLQYAVEGGQIVPLALHGPNLIPPGRKRFLRVFFHAQIDQKRLPVAVQGNATRIVMIMAVGVAAGLGRKHPAAPPCNEHAHTGIKDIAGPILRARGFAACHFGGHACF